MPGPNLAGVHAVVSEVAVGNVAVLVPDQAVAVDDIRVERDLDLRVPGYHLKVGGEVVGERLPRLGEVVDVDVVTVAVVGELFHEDIVVVAHADADG